jgi:hypothetical protein
LFVIINRGAYEGYFQDDEIDNLSWAPDVPVRGYLSALVTPKFLENNFRPVGHFYFHAAGRAFGTDFRKYVVPIHAIHLLNALLLWLLLRRLGADAFAASAGALFFAFHMAVFDVYWKPMYVFDLLCGTFSIACILLYVRGQWILAVAAMWLAYKCKELAVMLPVALAAYEFWIGKRRWKRLLPFVAVSLLFGVQGVVWNPHKTGAYAMDFTLSALLKTVRFYESKLLLLPFAGLVLVSLAAWTGGRRAWVGLVAMLGFFVPLAFLPGRLFSAYTYVPLVGAAIAFSALARRERAALAAVFFALWIPWNIFHLKANRRSALTIAEENRRYVQALGRYLQSSPETKVFIYDGRPLAFAQWGIEGAIRWFTGDTNREVYSMEAFDVSSKLQSASVAVLSWDPAARTLRIVDRQPGAAGAAFIEMTPGAPVWQLGHGWYALEGGFRWTEPVAAAWLHRPGDARRFEATFNVNQELLDAVGPTHVEVFLDGSPAGSRLFDRAGRHTSGWEIPEAPPGKVKVEFRIKPGYRPPGERRSLGVAVISFGFRPRERP